MATEEPLAAAVEEKDLLQINVAELRDAMEAQEGR